jgi:hypothetical protein
MILASSLENQLDENLIVYFVGDVMSGAEYMTSCEEVSGKRPYVAWTYQRGMTSRWRLTKI